MTQPSRKPTLGSSSEFATEPHHVPLPVNRRTVNEVFNIALADGAAVQAFLRSVAEPIEAPRNAAEYLRSQIGGVLTDLFFRPYTKKMWALDLEDMSADVVKRIPIRFNDDDRYFPGDRFQFVPARGYAALFETIFNHPGIRVRLRTGFEHGMERGHAYCFNSMPIDEFFGFRLGELPYRSIRFHHENRAAALSPGWAVTNYTDAGPFTRETHWHALPAHHLVPGEQVTVTVEEPCDYRENDLERYYPVKTADNRYADLYTSYKAMAADLPNMKFIGRCGTYQYLDMHQVINQSLMDVGSFLREYGSA